MRSRCTCQSGLERWRWWAQTHGGFSSHSCMFRRMYAGCDLKATSVWHNLYVPWMPSRCTCQMCLKRSHSWELMYIFTVLTQAIDSVWFVAYRQDMPITTPPVWHSHYVPWMPSRCTCQICLKRSHSWEPMYIFMVLKQTIDSVCFAAYRQDMPITTPPVWHNQYAPWMPSRCTCQIGLKRQH
jgi:hypothetical protein